MDRAIRFAAQVAEAPSGPDWIAKVRRLEELGYDSTAVPEQMVGSGWSSMLALTAAAAKTTRLRLSTLALNNDMHDPVALARDREKTPADVAMAGGDSEIAREPTFMAVGNLQEIQGHIVRLREDLGITYVCRRGPYLEELGPVVEELAGRR